MSCYASPGEQQLQGRPNATASHRRLSKPRHRGGHRPKQNGTSSRPCCRHSPSTTRPLVSSTVDTFTFAKSHFRVHSLSSVYAGMMLDLDGSLSKTSRKDRNFNGGDCAVCELSLEHKLSGEKVLQFSCAHLAHETCLYEYIKNQDEQFCPTCDQPLKLDSARGGSVLDLQKLSSMVRSITQVPGEMIAHPSLASQKAWDDNALSESAADTFGRPGGRQTYNQIVESREVQLRSLEQPTTGSLPASGRIGDFTVGPQPGDTTVDVRKHDYDLSEMESMIKTRELARDIPRPKVTIRSEFPTLTRSTNAQSLTCLVTVEVPPERTRYRTTTFQHPLSNPLLSFETVEKLEAIATDLKQRVDSWHGLETDRFGPLRLHANVKVGRDGINWQKLDCFLFSDLLICVREKRGTSTEAPDQKPPFQLKGSVLIQRHLKSVECARDDLMLTLNLAVATLSTFRLKFSSREQLDVWRLALAGPDPSPPSLFAGHEDSDTSGTDDEAVHDHRPISIDSSTGAKTTTTAPTDYDDAANSGKQLARAIHVPVDIVVVIPLSSSMQGLKIKLLKDALKFLVTHLGEHDRMGLVAFGSTGGAVPLVGMATKEWYGWRDVYRSIKPVGQKSLRADAVEGANVALDLLSQRRFANSISSILLISDSPTYETDSLDSVVRRAHQAKAGIYSFGLGQTHKPDNLIELSSRTNASYVYVKDWMMLRECIAGCLGSLQSISHVGAKLKLKIPEGSVAKFIKVTGALHTTKRTTGREAEAVLGDLRFGDKRDILVQLTVDPDASMGINTPQDHWEALVSGLTTLGGSVDDGDAYPPSAEEVPLMQADLSYGDLAREGATAHLSHPSLFAITMLPSSRKSKRNSRGSIIPPVPSHPSIVQRRMEMLTSDMLTRALTLVSRGQHENAHRLLAETRTILQGLGKGKLPPLPPTAVDAIRSSRSSSASKHSRSSSRGSGSPKPADPAEGHSGAETATPEPPTECEIPKASDGVLPSVDTSSSNLSLHATTSVPSVTPTIDPSILTALDGDIEACLEFIEHPAVFSHDARKAALQTIGVIVSQRGYTFRTETESFWASRIDGVTRMGEITKDWQMVGDDTVTETLAEEQ